MIRLLLILIIFVALQPLHSYTFITISNSDDSNGFEHLHAELCGTKYTDSISHTKQITDLLDKINTAIITDMGEDCVCCEAIDIAHYVLIQLSGSHILISTEVVGIHRNFYAPNVKILIPYTNQVRAPPIV